MTEIPLKARINGAKAWKPKPDRTQDEMITGTVVAIVPRTSDYGILRRRRRLRTG